MSHHLDPERWAALCEGRLPPAEAEALADHLETECERCEAFLAERGAHEVDPFDAEVDALLLAGQAEGPEDALGWRRLSRRLAPAPRRRAWSAAAGALALAAGLLLFLRPGPELPGGRDKGAGPALAPTLSLLLVEGEALRPLPPGASVPVGAVLAFEISAPAPACVQLWREGEALFDAPRCLEAGRQVLEAEGVVLGLTLDAPGPLTLGLGLADRGPEGVEGVFLNVTPER